jgi:hypothetical protein
MSQMTDPCTNLSDSAISANYAKYSSSVKRHDRLDSLNFIFELPHHLKITDVTIWVKEQGGRCWFNRLKSVLMSGVDSANVVFIKFKVAENDPESFRDVFARIQQFRRTFNIAHCGIYTKYSLKDLSSNQKRAK